jgi:HlyD family secretion protein
MTMSCWRVRCLALLILALVLAGCSVSLPALSQARSDLGLAPAAKLDVASGIEASGNIEADKVAVAAELPGRIVALYAGEGQEVEAGQTLVQLDTETIDAQIAQAQAALASAEAELERLRAGSRPAQVAGAEAAVAQAETRLAGAKQAWEDALRLRDNPLALDTKISNAESEVRLAEARVEKARAALSEAKVRYESYRAGGSDVDRSTKEILGVQAEAAAANLELAQLAVAGAKDTLAALLKLKEQPAALDAAAHRAEAAYRAAEAEVAVKKAALALVQAGARPEELALAERKVELAKRTVEALQARRDKLTLRAPIAGLVSSQVAHVGEAALPGATLLTIADLARVRLVIYVPESQIGRVRVGQPAEVSVNSYAGRVFRGTVAHVATQAEFTPRNVQTKEERVNTVFAVKIELENPERILKPGMPADAVLRPAN